MTDNPIPDHADERPPIESAAIDAIEIEPEGEGHVADDPIPHPEMAPPSYEAGQAVGGVDANPGGSTDPGNARTESLP